MYKVPHSYQGNRWASDKNVHVFWAYPHQYILSFEITLPLGRLSNDFWMWTSSLNTMHLFSFFVATGVSWEVVSSAPSTSEITIFRLNNLLWCCMCIGIRCIIVHFENFKQNHHGISQLWWNYRVQSWIFKHYWFYLKIYFKDFE